MVLILIKSRFADSTILCRFQENRTDSGCEQAGIRLAEADVRQEMIGHMHAVVSAENHKDADGREN